MSHLNKPVIITYFAATLAVGVVLVLRLALVPVTGHDAPFLLFFVAVMVAAWFGGLGPGLLATALATFCNYYFFMQPFEQFALSRPDQPPQLGLFFVEGLCISLICTSSNRRCAARRRTPERLANRIAVARSQRRRAAAHRPRPARRARTASHRHLTAEPASRKSTGRRTLPTGADAARLSAWRSRRSSGRTTCADRSRRRAGTQRAGRGAARAGVQCSSHLQHSVQLR